MWNFAKIHDRERILDGYHKLLDVDWNPQIKLRRIELPQQHFCKEEKAHDDHQFYNMERSPSMDQENPEPPLIKLEKQELRCSQDGQQLIVKQEMDTSLFTRIYGESDHSKDPNLSAAQNEPVVNMPVISSVVGAPNSYLHLFPYKPHLAESQDQKDYKHEDYESTNEAEPNINKQQHKRGNQTDDECKQTMLKISTNDRKGVIDPLCRLLDTALKPKITLHRIDFPHQYICRKEGILTEQKLFKQERNSSVEQEELESPQIKRERLELCSSPEVEQHVMKQETDTFMLNPTFKEKNNSEGQTLYLNLGETLNASRIQSVVNMPKGDTGEKDLNLHAKLHVKTGAKPYVCQTCGKDFISKNKLTVHMRTHTGDRPYVCETCGKDFRINGNLTVHNRIHTGERPYVCQKCGKGFTSNWKLTVHKTIHTGEKLYVCQTCGKDFRLRDTLKCHMRIHTSERPLERPFVCKICGKGFMQNVNLTIHMRVHSDEKPYVCKTCGKEFRYKSNLTVHMRVHTGEKPYVCKACGKGFKTSSRMTIHKRIHTGEKPYVCETCGKGFKSKGDLIVHIRIHTGEKPYVCKKCGKGFGHNGNLAAHMKIHLDGKPYKGLQPATKMVGNATNLLILQPVFFCPSPVVTIQTHIYNTFTVSQ